MKFGAGDPPEGVAHTHDRRECWDCGGVGIVNRAISIRVVERVLINLGWRFLEHRGRMVCPSCASAARAEGRVWYQPKMEL